MEKVASPWKIWRIISSFVPLKESFSVPGKRCTKSAAKYCVTIFKRKHSLVFWKVPLKLQWCLWGELFASAGSRMCSPWVGIRLQRSDLWLGLRDTTFMRKWCPWLGVPRGYSCSRHLNAIAREGKAHVAVKPSITVWLSCSPQTVKHPVSSFFCLMKVKKKKKCLHFRKLPTSSASLPVFRPRSCCGSLASSPPTWAQCWASLSPPLAPPPSIPPSAWISALI